MSRPRFRPLDSHGQNVLFEVDDNGASNRIVHRDLSIGIDMRRRRQIHLPDGNLNAYIRMQSSEFHCNTYDTFMEGIFAIGSLPPARKNTPRSSKRTSANRPAMNLRRFSPTTQITSRKRFGTLAKIEINLTRRSCMIRTSLPSGGLNPDLPLMPLRLNALPRVRSGLPYLPGRAESRHYPTRIRLHAYPRIPIV